MKKIVAALIVIAVFAVGFTAGNQTTIKNAELYEVTDDGYSISYGEEIHSYTYNLDSFEVLLFKKGN